MSVYLFLTGLSLRCCAGYSLVAASGSCSLLVVHEFLIVEASLGAEHRLCGSQASVVAAPRL